MSNQNKKKTKTMEMGFQVDAPPSNDNICKLSLILMSFYSSIDE